jgi:beta-N-acetylhexosaminidase
MAIDPTAPATLSRRVISEVIRGEIGFDGVLVSDDLSMRSLGGEIGERAQHALAAGCDLVLHCNGKAREMEDVIMAARPVSAKTSTRLARAEALRRRSEAAGFNRQETEAQFNLLLVGAPAPELPAR